MLETFFMWLGIICQCDNSEFSLTDTTLLWIVVDWDCDWDPTLAQKLFVRSWENYSLLFRAFGNQVVSQIEYLCTQHYDTHHSPKKKNYDTHPVHKRHSLFLPKRKSSTHIYNLFYIIFYKDFYNLTREKKSLGPDHKCSTPWPHQNHLALPGCVF